MSIRERIIEEATGLFLSQGLRSVRMDDIASHMGISKRTIYETFGDKENLVAGCVRYYFEQNHEYVKRRSAGAENLIEELMINLNSNEEMTQKGTALMADLRKFFPKVHAQIYNECFEEGTGEIKKILDRGSREGYFLPEMNTELTVTIFIDLMQTVVQRINSAPLTGQPLAETIRFCILCFVRGIATLHGVEMIDQYLAKQRQPNDNN